MRMTPVALLIGLVAATARGQIAFDGLPITRTGIDLTAVTTADVDGDGHQDFVIASYYNRTETMFRVLSVYFGDGQGDFRAVHETTIGLCRMLTAADFDEDGRADLVARLEDDRLVVLRGDGTGAFAVSVELGTVPSTGRVLLLVADLDEDGHQDLLAGLATGPAIFTGDGAGGLSLAAHPALNGTGRTATAADVDGDGHVDLVIGHEWGYAQASVFRGLGGGAFAAGQRYPLYTHQMNRPPTDPSSIRVVDVNHDGRADIVALASGLPLTLFATANGSFATVVASPPGGSFDGCSFGDFDRDGNWDLVGAEGFDLTVPGAGGFCILSGDGAGRFTQTAVISVGMFPTSAVAVDWNEDGLPDLAAVDRASERIVTRLANPLGGFLTPRTARIGSYSPIVAGDSNEDGELDLAGTNFVLASDGVMSFRSPTTIDPGLLTRKGVATADFDGDGHVDRVVSGEGFTECGPYCTIPAISFQQGNGDGSFAAPLITRLSGPGFQATSIAVADFDEDDHPDVAAPSTTNVAVCLGDGAGGFGSQMLFPAAWPLDVLQVEAADFDGDGHVDLFASSEYFGASFYSGLGDGTFLPARQIDVGAFSNGAGRGVHGFALADFDADGALDVAILFESNLESGRYMRLRILLGDGQGSFLPGGFARVRRRVGNGGVRHFLAAADFDEDGRVDVAAASPDSPDLLVFAGDGAGGLTQVLDLETGGLTATSLIAADFDRDGHSDLVVSNARTASVSVLYNRSFLPQYRVGSVNAAVGPVANVLFINGSAGIGDERRVVVPVGSPLEIRMDEPPSRVGQGAGFALFDWKGEPNERTVWRLPFDLGFSAMPTPLSRGAFPQPHRAANNLGHPILLGMERWPGPPTHRAPTVLLSLAHGVHHRGTAYFQAIVRDTASPNGVAAITNGIVLQIE